MNVTELSIPGLFVLESPVHGDDRGYFREWFKSGDLEVAGATFQARQANLSLSARDVVRGLHYSLAPEGQAKVVTCVFGELDDVIVDVRVGSPSFARVEVVHLAHNLGCSVLLPAGVAHGFCVTSEQAALSYLLSSPFNAPLELEINPFDAALNVPWSLTGEAIVSEKDARAPSLAERLAANELPRFV
ncbi:MAG: dTDP-4-keto-6-deoxy-D-glucose epimerase [Acidobacteria bacterium]|nr:dTDP-4-keto-6-deoxy-D-glucose epimerase [Acidobacteriota bacterium]